MARIMAALLALHSFARPKMRTCVVLGSRWRLPHATAEVDVPYKARFTEEERAKRALPGEAGVWQPRPVAPQTQRSLS